MNVEAEGSCRPRNGHERRFRAIHYLRNTVRGKFVAVILLTTVTVLVIAGSAMLAHDLAVYRDSWAVDMASEANILAISAAPALAFDDQEVAHRSLSALQARPAVLAGALYRENGELYAEFSRSSEVAAPRLAPDAPSGIQTSGERVTLIQPIEYNGEHLGTLYLHARYDVAGRVRTYAGIFSVISVLSLLAAFALSSVLQRVFTVPLEDISRVARRIVHEQDYSLRLTPRTSDEIGLVVHALNGMLDEVQHRARALEQSNEALRFADHRKDEFLATLAHELRNPLAPIRHATRVLDTSRSSEEQRKWAREVITRQVEHMALLLDDLLDVSRITRGRLGLKSDYVELDTIVATAVETAKPLVDAKQHTLQIDLPSEAIGLNVDPLRLSQALANLLTNAAKYTDPHGHIRLWAEKEQNGVVIGVQDDGIGLTQAALPKIFEMFSQVESALERSQGGLGIGLALVKGLIELHGGRIEAISEGVGMGSTFIVRLPQARVVSIARQARNGVEEEQPPGPVCKILIADDNRDAADSLAMLLCVAGHEVHVVYSGTDVVNRAQDLRPDAFILDIGMPHMNGYEVAEWIRKQPWGSSVLLMALTGWGQREDVDRAREVGFDHHFTKPVDTSGIERALAEHCAQRSV